MPIEVRLQVVTKQLDLLVLLAAPHASVRTFVDSQPIRILLHIGIFFTFHAWSSTSSQSNVETRMHPMLMHFVANALQMPNVSLVRLGRGSGFIPSTRGFTMCLMRWWHGPHGAIHSEEFDTITT